MGRRAWLTELLEKELFPAIVQLKDSPKGRQQCQQLAKQLRDRWVEHGKATLKQQQGLMDQTRRAIKDKFGEDHFSLDCINFTTEEYTELNDLKQHKVAERNTQCILLESGNINALITRSVNLLQSKEWTGIAAALAVLTGRRSTEVIATAEFTPKTKYSVIFTGALKRRGEEQTLSFEIPTLCQAEYVLKALERLRGLVDVEGKTRDAINAQYGRKIADACDRHFADLIPTRPDKDNLYSHLFRAVYGTIAVWFYCPVNVDATEFKAHCQGHFAVLDAKTPQLRRQLASSRHYSDFKIGDGKGNIDGRQGIHLDWQGVEVLEVFKEAAEKPQPTISDRKHRSSLRVWREDHDAVAQILEQFEGKTQPERVSAWVAWTQQQLASSSTILESRPNDLPEEASAVSIEQNDLQDHIADDETSSLEASIDLAEQLPDPVTASPQQTAVGGLEAKLDKLVDVMAEFIQFQMRMQQATLQPVASASSTNVATSQPVSIVQPTTTTPQKAAPTPPETGEAAKETKVRKYKTGEADATINAAIDAIMAHNNQPDQPHDLKWAITINGLKNFTANQRVIERVMHERRSEIEAHHQQHQIQPGHNNRHKRKRKIGDVIQL